MSVRDELIGLIEADAGIDEECAAEVLDALLADPVGVLRELENAPCQTCGGDKFMRDAYGRPTEDDCSACGGSGKLGRDGLLRLLGMEQWELCDLGVDEEGSVWVEGETP